MMKTRISRLAVALFLMLAPLEAAFRDLLAGYINAMNGVVTVLSKVKSEAEAKSSLAAIDAAVTALAAAKAQVTAGSTNASEVSAAVAERKADLEKATSALAEQTQRVRKISPSAASLLAKLAGGR